MFYLQGRLKGRSCSFFILKNGCINFLKMVAYAISRSVEGKRTFDEKGGFCKKNALFIGGLWNANAEDLK